MHRVREVRFDPAGVHGAPPAGVAKHSVHLQRLSGAVQHSFLPALLGEEEADSRRHKSGKI